MAKKATELKFDSSTVYTFELVGEDGSKHEGKYVIPTSGLSWDEDKNKYRKVRLSPTSESPFVDEQGEDAVTSRSPIIFRKGRLTVSGQEAYKIKYLLSLDHNSEKKSGVNFKSIYKYKLIDKELTEKEKAELRKLKLKIQNILAEASKEDLADYLLAEYNFVPQTDTFEEVFNKASAYAEVNPKHVLDTFQTEASKMKARFKLAFAKNILKNTKGVVTWADTGTEVQVFKPKEDEQLTDLMVDWVSKNSKEATDFVKKLATKMTV